MPGKARRVASRQAQLNRRKKQQRASRPAPVAATVPASGSGTATADPENGRQAEPVPRETAPVQAAPSAPSADPAARPVSQARARREQTLSPNYTIPEVRRILLLSSVVFAAIIVLAIVVP